MTIKHDYKKNIDEFAATIETSQERKFSYNQSAYSILSRLMDLSMALIGIILAFPILLFFCIAIKLESPGSIFYFQERVGLNGKCFNIIKLRSMYMDAEKEGAQWAEQNDSRVTKIGSFIRKTRIDEIPQLVNVIRGDMSMIGPRPERPIFTSQFNKEIPGFVNRLAVKPGITGWAQVNGGYDITPEKKLKHDLYYIENRSLVLDMKIIFNTIRIVITSEGAR